MNKSFTYLLLFFAAFFLFSSCKTSKGAAGKKLKKRKKTFLLEQLNANKKDAEWLSCKAQINYKDDYQKIKLSANIRMRKDSVIWMNVKKLGVEAARIQITPDSISVIDRINKEYTTKGYKFITKQLQLPNAVGNTINFAALQDLLLGNPIFVPVKELNAAVDDQSYLLSGEYDDIESSYWIQGVDYELGKFQFVDNFDDKTALFTLSDYQRVGDELNFAYFRSMEMNSASTGELQMTIQLNKLEINVPTSMKFEISSRYKRID